MNYPLLVTIWSLAAGMLGLERWCSWRSGVMQRRGPIDRACPPRNAAEEATPADAPTTPVLSTRA